MKKLLVLIGFAVLINAVFLGLYIKKNNEVVVELKELNKQLKETLPISSFDLPQQSRSFMLYGVPGKTMIAATEDYQVKFSFPSDKFADQEICILCDSGGKYLMVIFPKGEVHPGETIWWDRMDSRNILYHQSQQEVISKMY